MLINEFSLWAKEDIMDWELIIVEHMTNSIIRTITHLSVPFCQMDQHPAAYFVMKFVFILFFRLDNLLNMAYGVKRYIFLF